MGPDTGGLAGFAAAARAALRRQAPRSLRGAGASAPGDAAQRLASLQLSDARVEPVPHARRAPAWRLRRIRFAVGALAPSRLIAGVVVLVVGASLCLVAYRLMMRIGRLPVERRILS